MAPAARTLQAGAVRAEGGFARILAGCRPLFPPALVDDAGWERLLEGAKPLPRCVIDTLFGFEFHLAEPRAAADLCVVAFPDSDLARHYIRAGAPGERARGRTENRSLAAALRQQAEEPESWLARSVAYMLLEYDLAGPAPPHHAAAAAPGVFFAPTGPPPAGSQSPGGAHRDPAGLLAALAAIAGWDDGDTFLPQFERIFAALPGHGPNHGHVGQAGVLPGRSPQAFRFLVQGIGQGELPALLRRLRWPGPVDAAADALAAMDGLVARIAVSIDVTRQGTGPRLGLELYRAPRWLALDRDGWRPFIARIAENGWCLAAKAGGLQDWTRSERLLGGGEIYRIRQGINHIKLVIEQGAPTVAKAYVGVDIQPYGALLRPPPAPGQP